MTLIELEARIDAKTIGDLGEILKLCRRALDQGLDEENTKFAKKLQASTYYQRGEALAKQVLEPQAPSLQAAQMRVSAVDDLSEALAADPEIAEAYILIARLQLMPGGDVKQARSMLERALTLKNVDPPTRANALLMHSAFRTKPEDRLKDLDEAVQLDPGNPQPLRLRAATKLGLDKAADAVADFDAALQLEPDHAATHEARGWRSRRRSGMKPSRASRRRARSCRGRLVLYCNEGRQSLGGRRKAALPMPRRAEDHPRHARGVAQPPRQLTGDRRGLADVDLLLERFPKAPMALMPASRLIDDNARRTPYAIWSVCSCSNRPTPTSRCKWPWCITARRIMRKRSPSPTSC
jgi:tetratricopeptide (TPR) repeat protein